MQLVRSSIVLSSRRHSPHLIGDRITTPHPHQWPRTCIQDRAVRQLFRNAALAQVRRSHMLVTASAIPPPPPPPPPIKPERFPLLPTSIFFYGAMTVGSIFLGKDYDVLAQLQSPLDLPATAPYLAAMLASGGLSVVLADTVPALRRLKELYQKALIPSLERVPIWGLAVMSAGAGIGEEALFRALLQAWLVQQLATVPGATSDVAVYTGLIISSVAFGAVHAATPSYFLFATFAGLVFGIEYLNVGLPAAAFTHGLYDFIAFLVIIKLWGSSGADKST